MISPIKPILENALKKLFMLLFPLYALAVSSASANVVVLNFQGLQNEEQVLNYYNGGLGGSGSGPGPNYGITFGSDSLSLISSQAGGSGNFAGNPGGTAALFFLSGPGDVMNVASGFTTGFSFYYSAINDPGTVTVWSGLNDTGTLLATINLSVTASQAGSATCGSDQFCPFVAYGVTFSGTAMSVDFSGTANQIAFGDITLGSSSAGGSAPEPSTYLLMAGGLTAVLGYRLRTRRA